MEHHHDALKLSGSSDDLVIAYQAVIDFVDMNGESFLDLPIKSAVKSEQGEQDDARALKNKTLDEIENIIREENISRRLLENLAVFRFGVPRGSMRKWSSKEELREKVGTMMRNERVHRTIGEVARLNTQRTGNPQSDEDS